MVISGLSGIDLHEITKKYDQTVMDEPVIVFLALHIHNSLRYYYFYIALIVRSHAYSFKPNFNNNYCLGYNSDRCPYWFVHPRQDAAHMARNLVILGGEKWISIVGNKIYDF